MTGARHSGVPGFHGAAINHLCVDILARLLGDGQGLQASIHQQDVPDADVVNEAVIVHADAVVGPIRTLLNRKGELVTCIVGCLVRF